MYRLLVSTCVAALLFPGAALAVDTGADAGDSAQDIIVTATQDRYKIDETSSATKTKTPLVNVPQSVSVVTKAQIDDQAIRSIIDLVRLVPGVSGGQGEGNRDQITLRGNNSTADFFLDGLRDDVQYFRSFYNLDRVEILKGPNATIFGRGGGGGVVNRVTKSPLAGVTAVDTAASIDTFADWSLAGDANVALGGQTALRVNGYYERLANHRDFYNGDRYAVNPVIATETASGVKLKLGYEYVVDARVADRGVPSQNGRPVTGFRDTFFGQPGVNQSDLRAHIVSGRIDAPLASNLTFTAQALYGDYDKSYVNVQPSSAIGGTASAPTVGIDAYANTTQRQNAIAQANLEWHVATGRIRHTILFGGDFAQQDSDNIRTTGFFSPTTPTAANRSVTVPLRDPLSIPTVYFINSPTGFNNRSTTSALSQGSLYLQDQIEIGDHLQLVGGIRYDRVELTVNNRYSGQIFARADDLWSPRGAIIVKPARNASIYASYTKSFLPQSGDQFTSLDVTTAALAPEQFDNYEIGAKWDVKPGLSLTAAAYQLDRSNTRAAGPVAGTIVLTGGQRTRGVELSATGRITSRWQATLGYGYTDAVIRNTTTAAIAGTRVAQVPRHQFSLWNRYQLTKGLGLGVAVYHQSDSFATISNAVTLPAYTRVDLAAFIKLSDTLDAQINIENVTNTRYFPQASTDNNINTGAPTNARFTIRARF